ncbi:cell division protein FtsL [Acetivibrio clariflavus]|uniref:Cell division protein FtsL n=1 Tax=Acetivibrio clariflavus (strain DSM 19732 / NBRC 101661 / EBR45) TaxID=720554 RepID=G8LZ57_ACECE|nr:cell division protein FtsL [Acetivibrio clariflavus]AEV69001.1 Cell division protein FtsL [Acetivibrio clariflavus DSM 19732]
MIKTDKNYIQGTAVRKLEYDVYKENKVLRQKKEQRANNKVKVKVVFAFMVLFALSGLVMYRYALITDLNYKINSKMIELNEIKNENTRLGVKIERELDLQKIQKFAEENLGMQKPDKSQCVFVKVPRSDFTTAASNNNGMDKNSNNIFKAILSKVDKFTELLY